jgi:hypothetical protein
MKLLHTYYSNKKLSYNELILNYSNLSQGIKRFDYFYFSVMMKNRNQNNIYSWLNQKLLDIMCNIVFVPIKSIGICAGILVVFIFRIKLLSIA